MYAVTHFATTAFVYPNLQDPPSFVELPGGGIACGRPFDTSGGLRTTNWTDVTCGRCFDARMEGVAIRLRWLRFRNVTLRAFCGTLRLLRGYVKKHWIPLATLLLAASATVVGLLNWLFPRA